MAWVLREAHLQKLCHWLDEVFLMPLRESLPDLLHELTLIPVGLTAGCRRTVLPGLPWTICASLSAPNARGLNWARAIRTSVDSEKIFIACNPQQNLPYEELETAIESFIPKQWVLYHQNAAIEAVKKRLPNCSWPCISPVMATL